MNGTKLIVLGQITNEPNQNPLVMKSKCRTRIIVFFVKTGENDTLKRK
jgi:hypothetical protein